MNEPGQTAAANTRCCKCNAGFTCGAIAGDERCWCMHLPPLTGMAAGTAACYCPDCLESLLSSATDSARR